MIYLYLNLVKFFCNYLPPIISQKLRDILFKKNSKKLPKSVLVQSVTGSFLRVDLNDFCGFPFFIHGYFDWRVMAIAKAVCQNEGSIVEVGANIGTETIGFTDIIGNNHQVYAFEPVPQLFKNLKEIKLKKNNLNIFPFIIGNKSKLLKFNLSKNLNNSAVGHISYSKSSEDEVIYVECKKLDSFFNSFKNISLIHIDAEGADLNVILGGLKLIKRDSPVIIAELSEKLLKRYNQSIFDFLSILSKCNYEIYAITRLGIKSFKKDHITKNKNVVCIPTKKIDLFMKINKMILKVGITPMLKYLNPLKTG